MRLWVRASCVAYTTHETVAVCNDKCWTSTPMCVYFLKGLLCIGFLLLLAIFMLFKISITIICYMLHSIISISMRESYLFCLFICLFVQCFAPCMICFPTYISISQFEFLFCYMYVDAHSLRSIFYSNNYQRR